MRDQIAVAEIRDAELVTVPIPAEVIEFEADEVPVPVTEAGELPVLLRTFYLSKVSDGVLATKKFNYITDF